MVGAASSRWISYDYHTKSAMAWWWKICMSSKNTHNPLHLPYVSDLGNPWHVSARRILQPTQLQGLVRCGCLAFRSFETRLDVLCNVRQSSHLCLSRNQSRAQHRWVIAIFWLALSRDWGNEVKYGYDGDSFPHSLPRASQFFNLQQNLSKDLLMIWCDFFPVSIAIIRSCMNLEERMKVSYAAAATPVDSSQSTFESNPQQLWSQVNLV